MKPINYLNNAIGTGAMLALLLITSSGCTSTNMGTQTASGSGEAASASAQPPTPAAPDKPLKKGVVAIVSVSASGNSDAERKYTAAIAEEVRAQLNDDKTITVLPSSVSDNTVAGFVVPGFVSTDDELKTAASRLPAECNVLIVAGPFPTGSGWFSVRIDRPNDLAGVSFNFGPPKLDGSPKDVVAGSVIRGDIDVVLKSE